MIKVGAFKIPFPSQQDIKAGTFDYLLAGKSTGQDKRCGVYWKKRFGLQEVDGKIVATAELKELWNEEGVEFE